MSFAILHCPLKAFSGISALEFEQHILHALYSGNPKTQTTTSRWEASARALQLATGHQSKQGHRQCLWGA